MSIEYDIFTERSYHNPPLEDASSPHQIIAFEKVGKN